MSSMIGEAFVRLRSDDSLYRPEVRRQVQGATRDIERTNREFSRFGRGALVGTGALGQLGRAAAFASTSFIGGAGLVVGLKAASDAASNLNEQTARSEEIFGRSATTIEEWSRTSASALLLARDQAVGFAGDFGTILVGLGQAEKQAADTSTELVQLGADLASFANTPVPDALAAIRSGLVGEIEPLRRYGVILSEAAVSQEALTNTGKKSVEQLTAQEKVQARLNLIFAQTALQQGDVARTSESLANQQRQLSANVRNLGIVLGQALNPEINRLVTSLNEWLADTENQEAVQREFQNAVRDGVAVVEGFGNALETIHTVTGPLVDGLGGVTNAVELLLIAMAANRVLRFSGALTAVGTDAAVAAGRVGALRLALLRLGAIGVIAVGVDLLLGGGDSAVAQGLRTEGTTAAVFGDRGSPFPKGSPNDVNYQKAFDQLVKSGRLRGQDLIEALRTVRETERLLTEIPARVKGSGQFGRETNLLEQLRLAVAAAGLTPGTQDDVRALQAQREQYEKALQFALRQLELGRGNTREFANQAENLSADIAGINEQLAGIAEANAQKAQDARERMIEALIPGRLGGTTGGFAEAAQAFVAGRLGAVQGGTFETDLFRALEEQLEAVTLRTRIAEQRVEEEEDLLPFLQRERKAVTDHIRLLKRIGADKNEILQAVLQQATLDRRIAEIRKQSADEFGVQDLFSLAAGEFAGLASNIAPIDVALSPQEAGGAAVRAARSVSVNQHFYGEQPNPAQALQQASQAARALR